MAILPISVNDCKPMKALLTACALLLLPPLCPAGVIYVDTSDDSSGSGVVTLRDAITASNGDGVDTNIIWRYTGGQISLAASMPNINGVTSLDVTNAASAVTLYSSNDNYTLGLGGTVTVKNDNTASPVTISVILTSTGSLTKDGDGTLYLMKDNTYSGGTIFKKGIVSIKGDANLGAASGALTFDGGTLQLRGNISSARELILLPGGGTIDTNTSYTLYLTGVISGAGGLTKASGGTLVLSGPNVYTGGTIVGGGTLRAGSNNALPSGGAVTVASGAELDLGAYTQTIDSYAGAGTLALTLGSGVTNLAITNAAALSGTLAVGLAPQVVTAGEIFTPLSAASITGQFTGITGPAALSFTPTYNSGSVVLTAGLVPFSAAALTRNQRTVGNGLESFRAAPAGDTAAVLGNLYTLNAAQLRAALDQISPFAFGAMRGLGLAGADIQSAEITRRADALAGTAIHGRTGSNDLTERSAGPDEFDPAARRSGAAVSPGLEERFSRGPWGFFASGAGTIGKVNKEADALPGYKFYSGGLMMGADYSLGEHLAAGVLGGYLDGQASVSSPWSATIDNSSARYAVYAAAYGETFRAGLYAGKASDLFTTERKVAFGDISRKATAKPGGREVNMGASASYDGWGPVSSFAGLDYDSLKIDGFTEKGADSLDLKVARQTAESLRSSLGVRYADSVTINKYLVSSYVSAAWRHEFKDKGAIASQLASGSGGVFSTAVGGTARDSALGGIGVCASWGGRTTVNLDYSADFSSHFVGQVINAGMRIKF